MGSAPQPPKPSDPGSVAQAQGEINKETAIQNQVGSQTSQVNPFGSLTYSQTGTGPNGIPLYTATSKLDPSQQAILDQLNAYKLGAGGQATNLLSSRYGVDPQQFIGNYTSGLTKDMLDKEVSYLDPYFTRDANYLDTKLKNQGFSVTDPAYKSAMDALRQSQGGTVTNFLANMEPQAFSQASSIYGLPYNLAASLAGQSQPSLPSWINTPGFSNKPANYQGAVATSNQQAMDAYKANLGQYGNMMSGMFGIPTAVLGGWAKGGFQGAGGAMDALSGLFGGAGAADAGAALAALV